jgi:chitin synthase
MVAKPIHSTEDLSSASVGADQSGDLIFLQQKNKSSVVNTLQQRYSQQKFYTKVGDRVLLSVNPCKEVDDHSPANREMYVQNYRNISEDRERLPAHIFQLANTIYFHLKRSGIDQSVVFM